MLSKKAKFHLLFSLYFALILVGYFAVLAVIDAYIIDESLIFKSKRLTTYIALVFLVAYTMKWVKGAYTLENITKKDKSVQLILDSNKTISKKGKFHLRFALYFIVILACYLGAIEVIDIYLTGESLIFYTKKLTSFMSLITTLYLALKYLKGARVFENNDK